MKARSLGGLGPMLAILLPGAIAAAVVGRVLLLYWGSDPPASVIVLAIAAALGLGLLELVLRQLRIRRLEQELAALPKTPRAATLDIASAELSALLRARLERVPGLPASDGIAPFLSGLLVMLGLLGTLLGLFQTVHGAGEALTAAGDVDSLRRGLRAPIAGLTRSFGCSAAGISASAMLGLALALVRRREARMLRAVSAYAAGQLRSLSSDARQTRALEQLASQNTALPAAVAALERVVDKIGELSSQLQVQHKGVHDEFARAAGETGRVLHAHVTPLFEQLAAGSGAALAEVARNVTREIEQDAKQRRDDAARALEGLRTRLDVAEGARAAAHARELEALTDLHARTHADSEQRWRELLLRLDSQLEAARAAEVERLRGLEAQAQAAREHEREQLEQLEGLRARVGEELVRLAAELRQQLEAAQASGRERDARQRELEQLAKGALERVDRSSELFDGAIARQAEALEALIARVGGLLPELAEAAQSGAAHTLARLRELAEQQSERLASLERELAGQLTGHASELELGLSRTSAAVQEASAIWRASSAEMQGVAQLFASSVDRQREASEAWLESLGDVEAAVERAGRHAASDALSDQLASTQELFTRQLQFQRELLEQLRALRGGAAQRFANGERDVSTRE